MLIALTRVHNRLHRILCALFLRCSGQIHSRTTQVVPWGLFQVRENALQQTSTKYSCSISAHCRLRLQAKFESKFAAQIARCKLALLNLEYQSEAQRTSHAWPAIQQFVLKLMLTYLLLLAILANQTRRRSLCVVAIGTGTASSTSPDSPSRQLCCPPLPATPRRSRTFGRFHSDLAVGCKSRRAAHLASRHEGSRCAFVAWVLVRASILAAQRLLTPRTRADQYNAKHKQCAMDA